ncbi:MAG TPA: hypothetical protein VLX32_04920 [Candidatus Acidoferrum sp.]|nr:hypothetical protein [Candidatus Acidoferrum sp.]
MKATRAEAFGNRMQLASCQVIVISVQAEASQDARSLGDARQPQHLEEAWQVRDEVAGHVERQAQVLRLRAAPREAQRAYSPERPQGQPEEEWPWQEQRALSPAKARVEGEQRSPAQLRLEEPAERGLTDASWQPSQQRPGLPFPLSQRLPPQLPPPPGRELTCELFPRHLRGWNSNESSFP